MARQVRRAAPGNRALQAAPVLLRLKAHSWSWLADLSERCGRGIYIVARDIMGNSRRNRALRNPAPHARAAVTAARRKLG
jgi:hypothetical protein